MFKRGDRILVKDHITAEEFERIFVTYIKGAMYPYITVIEVDESDFFMGEKFRIKMWEYAEPITEKKH
jgi:hypothetical protein